MIPRGKHFTGQGLIAQDSSVLGAIPALLRSVADIIFSMNPAQKSSARNAGSSVQALNLQLIKDIFISPRRRRGR